MSVMLKIICAIILIGVVRGQNSTTFSILNEIDRMMAMINQRLQHLFGFSSHRAQLDALIPNCSNTTSNSIQKARRRTITCTKELVLNGTKQFYQETNITNAQGVLISQSKIYQTIRLN